MALVQSPLARPQVDPETDTHFRSILSFRSTKINQIAFLNPDFLHFGPDYHVRTNSGFNLRILTTFAHYLDHFREHLDVKDGLRKFWLIALSDDQPVALVQAKIEREASGKTISHEILTGIRGFGLATAIESAFVDLMQRNANETQESLTWIVQNENLIELLAIADKVKKGILEQEVLDAKELEQQRWQHLYADHGIFGLNNSERIFKPTCDKTPLTRLDTIELTRQGPLYLPSLVTECQPDQFRQRQLRHLRDIGSL